MLQVEQAIATSFENFDFVVEAFHKTAVGSLEKEIGNLLPPMVQGFDKLIKAG
jgi:hypothetical protein